MEEKLLKIISFYGVIPQLKHFQSEVFELNEAIIRYEDITIQNIKCKICRKVEIYDLNFYRKLIAEEIADCLVMLNQFQHYYNISDEQLDEIFKYKVDRQLERIEKEEK